MVLSENADMREIDAVRLIRKAIRGKNEALPQSMGRLK